MTKFNEMLEKSGQLNDTIKNSSSLLWFLTQYLYLGHHFHKSNPPQQVFQTKVFPLN